MEQQYWPEFLIFATTHVLSLISPGPDFFMVLQSSLRYSRKSALWVALGIGCGEMVHVTYSILGVGFIITQSLWAFTVLKWTGGLYLIYLGVKSLKAPKEKTDLSGLKSKSAPLELEPIHAFKRGFLCNALNAKAAFFTISCFTVIISPQTPFTLQGFYAFFIFATTIVWFTLVTFFLTNSTVQGPFLGAKPFIEKTCGIFLLALGLKLGFSKFEPIANIDV